MDTWSPLGDLLLLIVYTLTYAIAVTSVPELFYASLQFFPILFVYSIPVVFAIERGYKQFTGNIAHTVFGYKGQVVTLGIGMVVAGYLIHTDPLQPASPAALLGIETSRLPFATPSANGVLISIWSASWYLFLTPALSILNIGWIRNREDWKDNLPAQIVWNGLVSSCVGILLWTALPSTTLPLEPHLAFQHLILGCAVFLYVYGIATD
jgi:hypothetical protein